MIGIKIITTGMLFINALIHKTATKLISIASHNLPILIDKRWRDNNVKMPDFVTPCPMINKASTVIKAGLAKPEMILFAGN